MTIEGISFGNSGFLVYDLLVDISLSIIVWGGQLQILITYLLILSGGVVPECKQKAAAGANEKNWRALGDIGNLVSVRVVEG